MSSIPDLKPYDWIVISTSAGKDSQVMMWKVVGEAIFQGCLDRVVAVHCDLGRCEWQGTKELAESHANYHGIPLIVVSRPQGDLLQHVEKRGKWPSPAYRYCTSDHKRGQAEKVYTRMAKWSRKVDGIVGRPVRILNCMGFRADESPARARREVFSCNEKASNSRKTVDEWLPIHEWTEGEVWERLGRIPTKHHPAYDLGMPRLSCCFCIFATREALITAGHANPELLAEYVRVEEKINHQFNGEPGAPGSISMAEIKRAVDAGEHPALTGKWGNQ